MSKTKNFVAGLIAGAALIGSANAQPPAKKEAAGFCLNSTQGQEGEKPASSTLCYEFIKSGDKNFWIDWGNNYDPKTKANNHDFGFKYFDKRNLFRAVLDIDRVSSEDSAAEKNVYGGIDWDLGIGSFGQMNVNILGDVATVKSGEKRRIDGSAGVKLNYGPHNAFALLSDRGENMRADSSLRLGYLYRDDSKKPADKVAFAGWTDLREGKLPVLSGYAGIKYDRFLESFDFDSKTLSSGMILTVGNNPLPHYAKALLIPGQIMMTTKNFSVHDADDYHSFQAPYFSYPAGRISDVAKVSMKNDFRNNRHSASVYNSFGINIDGKTLALLQSFTHSDTTKFGLGAAYDFGSNGLRVMPALRYTTTTQGDKGIVLDVEIAKPPIYSLKK